MTKWKDLEATEAEALALWNDVIEALLNKIQHHREQVLISCSQTNVTPYTWHVEAMHRAVETLAVFVTPYRKND